MTIMNPPREICNAFHRAAPVYEQVAKVQHEIAQRVLERLTYLKINPMMILDLGCGTGQTSKALKQRYPHACIVSLDSAWGMLQEARKKQKLFNKWPLVRGDIMQLPFAAQSFDLIFSNQVIHWAPSRVDLFKELNRVLKVGGCLMASTLGPDSFKELRQAWQQVDHYAHVMNFDDMHDIGDILLHSGFSDPVVDMELITIHYPEIAQLLLNLKQQGVRNINPQRRQGLTTRHTLTQLAEAYGAFKQANGKYPLTYEVVYLLAWKAAKAQTNIAGEAFIPISSIGKRSK